MASIQFTSFVELLRTAVKDPTFVRGNTLLQNPAFMEQMLARIDALNPDMNLVLDVTDVESTSGSMRADTLHNRITYDPAGYQIKLSNIDATVYTPSRAWVRTISTPSPGTTPADGVRYLVADRVKGVFQLFEDMTIKTLFPGLGQQAAGGYADAASVIAFTVSGTEYLAVAMPTHAIVRIFDYATGAAVATIGTLDTTGATGTLLNKPSDLAWDSTTNTLFIACQAGQPAGSTQSAGFVTRFDLTTPASPSLIDIYMKYSTNGSLLNRECNIPQGLFVQDGKLWVTNGIPSEVASIDLTTDRCSYYLGSSAIPGYPFASLGSVRVVTRNGTPYLFLANSGYGSVLSINLTTSALANVFSFTNQQSHLVQYGQYGAVSFAEPDRVTVDGLPKDIILTGDPENHRVVKIDEQVYLSTSICTFKMLVFPVPVRLLGYAIAGNIPADVVQVEYRFTSTSPWHVLGETTNVQPTSSVQFRISIQLPMGYPIDAWELTKLTSLAEQA